MTRRNSKGQFVKGTNGWLGKHHTDETKEKLRKARKGSKSPQVSRALKGRMPWNKGLKGVQTAWNKGKKYPQVAGKKNPNWKGGITPKIVSLRSSVEYHLWREAIHTKYSYTCQKCGDNRGGNLIAHHLFNFSDYPELRFSLDNGITFCEDCHKEFHGLYGYKNNTKKQIVEFLST